ncbi:MAG: hypothetical protein HY606_09515 [Planctomycetes bacterium]|nr:hypothetical protein [Planctomycetota bacterium]
MGSEVVLTKALENEVNDALRANGVANKFKKSGYQLWLGEKFGGQRNQFWYNPESGQYGINYANNLVHIPGTYLGPLGQMLGESNGNSQANADDSLQLLVMYIEENLQMCNDGKVVKGDKSLNVSNGEIFNDFETLMKKIKQLKESRRQLRESRFDVQQLRTGVDDILLYHELISQKYMEYDRN